MGSQGHIHPYHYYNPSYHEDGESENKLKNINNIKIDVVCPGCHRPKPRKFSKNKLVNINNINITVDGHKVRYDCW